MQKFEFMHTFSSSEELVTSIRTHSRYRFLGVREWSSSQLISSPGLLIRIKSPPPGSHLACMSDWHKEQDCRCTLDQSTGHWFEFWPDIRPSSLPSDNGARDSCPPAPLSSHRHTVTPTDALRFVAQRKLLHSQLVTSAPRRHGATEQRHQGVVFFEDLKGDIFLAEDCFLLLALVPNRPVR